MTAQRRGVARDAVRRADGVTALNRLVTALGGSRLLVAVLVATGYVTALLLTARSIGYSRDESFYFDAANRYYDWFRLLFNQRETALQRAVIDSHFSLNHEHPPLIKTLFGLSHAWFFEQHRWFSEPGITYRLPSMVLAGLGVGVLILWGSRVQSPSAGIIAGLSFALLPRIFHHAHLACFDVPVACMCLGTAYCWSRALSTGKLRWALGLGLVYGLTLATKHNAWLLPPALLLHGLCVKSAVYLKGSWATRARLMAPVLSLLVVGTLVLYALWPWLWFDTFERLKFWFDFHLKHEYYNMEFLGVTYWKPPMPRAYAWVMTLATVPFTTLVLVFVGGYYGTRDTVSGCLARFTARSPEQTDSTRASDFLLWVICLVTFYFPWLSTDTPIFGGTKHWFSAYPFLCLIAARGFEALRLALPQVFARLVAGSRQLQAATWLAAALVLAPSWFIVRDMGSWGLSTYTPIVGEASGAATLGLNRTFWGYTSIALADELNARAPARVFLHDMTSQAWFMHVRDGVLKPSLYGTNSVTESDMALYHHEPHMGRVEYQTWVAYGTATPSAIGVYQGVPVVWLYERHRAR